MAKLYFRYGTVGSAKTLNLLATAHNYRSQGKKILLIKPGIDSRYGEDLIRSRSGMEEEADFVVGDDTIFANPEDFTGDDRSRVIDSAELEGVICILVDEAQFLSESFVNQLHNISVNYDIPVICYGLRTDFRRRFFPGSSRLLEIADSIEEVKTTCAFCDRKAIFNLKLVGGVATLEGPTVDLGADEKYQPACKTCYSRMIAGAMPPDAGADMSPEGAAHEERSLDDPDDDDSL